MCRMNRGILGFNSCGLGAFSGLEWKSRWKCDLTETEDDVEQIESDEVVKCRLDNEYKQRELHLKVYYA